MVRPIIVNHFRKTKNSHKRFAVVIYEFCKKAVSCGVDIFRVFDSLNYDENLKLGVDAVVKAGGVAEGAISYTGMICSGFEYVNM